MYGKDSSRKTCLPLFEHSTHLLELCGILCKPRMFTNVFPTVGLLCWFCCLTCCVVGFAALLLPRCHASRDCAHARLAYFSCIFSLAWPGLLLQHFPGLPGIRAEQTTDQLNASVRLAVGRRPKQSVHPHEPTGPQLCLIGPHPPAPKGSEALQPKLATTAAPPG